LCIVSALVVPSDIFAVFEDSNNTNDLKIDNYQPESQVDANSFEKEKISL